jgi:hypothetical protein
LPSAIRAVAVPVTVDRMAAEDHMDRILFVVHHRLLHVTHLETAA